MVRERRLSEKERSGEKESEADGVMEIRSDGACLLAGHGFANSR